jgi:PmbA protein
MGAKTKLTLAEIVVKQMLAVGFTQAQVADVQTTLTEVNIEANRASLLRSTLARKLSLTGLVAAKASKTKAKSLESHKVNAECSDLSDQGISAAVRDLFASAATAPKSDAYAIAAKQKAQITQGPLQPNIQAMTRSAAGLLAWREKTLPNVKIGGGVVSHQLEERCVASSQDSLIVARMGFYTGEMYANASDGGRASSIVEAGGRTDHLKKSGLHKQFDMKAVFKALPKQIETTRITENFEGDVVLSAHAVNDLLNWLLEQVSDGALLGGTSILKDHLGKAIASELLTVRSRFDAPGVLPISSEGFLCKPLTLVKKGQLQTLLPSDYGIKKLGATVGNQRVPIPAPPGMFPSPHGWEIDAGKTSLKKMIGSVARGAYVGRFSMGRPAANGNFSGLIKNSFLIEDGVLGAALSETMIAANMGQMLKDIVQVSKERVEMGVVCLPAVRVKGVKFS